MNLHQRARLHNLAKTRLSLTGARRGLSIGFLVVFMVSVMVVWFGFLGWGLIELLRSLIDFAEYLWSTL